MKNTDAQSQSREDVFPLNVSRERYAELYESPLPNHLGIGLVLLLPDYTGPKLGLQYADEFSQFMNPMQALLEYDLFQDEFLRVTVDKVTITSITVEIPRDLLVPRLPNEPATHGLVFSATTYFFDADKQSDWMPKGCAMAMRAIDGLAVISGSYEPTSHGCLSLLIEDAEDYRDSVGDLYSEGVGIWCRALLPIHTAFHAGLSALLEHRPVISAIRSAVATPDRPINMQVARIVMPKGMEYDVKIL